MKCIRWGVLGAGSISHRFVAGLEHVEGAELVAVSGRDPNRLAAFAAKHGVDADRCYASPEDDGVRAHERLLADDGVDAVYIALPHGLHEAWSRRAMQDGKAVLCEKPATLCEAEAQGIARAARESRMLFMEAMKPRFTPVRARVRDLLDSGELGVVTGIDVVHRLYYGEHLGGYLLDSRQGGTLYDLGCYGVGWVEDLLGDDVAVERVDVDWIEGRGGAPVDIAEEARLVVDGVPVHLDFSGTSREYRVECRIDCERGSILIPMFHRPSELTIVRGRGCSQIEELPLEVDDFYGEITHFCELVRAGAEESPIMPIASTVRIARMIDAVRAAWGPDAPHRRG